MSDSKLLSSKITLVNRATTMHALALDAAKRGMTNLALTYLKSVDAICKDFSAK